MTIYTQKKVITHFEAYGKKFIVIEDEMSKDDLYTKEFVDGSILSEDGTEIIREGIAVWFVLLWVISGICWLVFIISPVDDTCYWEFSEIYNDCMIRNVKLDVEGNMFYYHYRGVILKVIDVGKSDRYRGQGLSQMDVSDLIKAYRQSPNLFERYIGTEKQIREDKINNLIANGE